ncbi:MAG: hypothetical protein RDV48_21050 [Candidatus Eremiobacteraeota bacterium]|nr:hypothetical protein [Candidatus Eremiobacteraeota bacterium]
MGGGMPIMGQPPKTPEQLRKEMEAMGIKSPWDLMAQMGQNQQNQNGVNNQGQQGQQGQQSLQNLGQIASSGDMMGVMNYGKAPQQTQQVQPTTGTGSSNLAQMGASGDMMGVMQGGKPQGGTAAEGLMGAAPAGDGLASAPAVTETAPTEGPQQARGTGEASIEEADDSVTVNLGDFEDVSGGGSTVAPSGSGGVIDQGIDASSVGASDDEGGNRFPPNLVTGSKIFSSLMKSLNGDS